MTSFPTQKAIYYQIIYSLAVLVRKVVFLQLENKTHIFRLPCNILYIQLIVLLYIHIPWHMCTRFFRYSNGT